MNDSKATNVESTLAGTLAHHPNFSLPHVSFSLLAVFFPGRRSLSSLICLPVLCVSFRLAGFSFGCCLFVSLHNCRGFAKEIIPQGSRIHPPLPPPTCTCLPASTQA